MTTKLAISVIATRRQPLAVAFNEDVAVVCRSPHEGLDSFRCWKVSGLRNFDPFAGRTPSHHAVNRGGFDSCLMNRHIQVSYTTLHSLGIEELNDGTAQEAVQENLTRARYENRGAESTLKGREIAKPIPLAIVPSAQSIARATGRRHREV